MSSNGSILNHVYRMILIFLSILGYAARIQPGQSARGIGHSWQSHRLTIKLSAASVSSGWLVPIDIDANLCIVAACVPVEDGVESLPAALDTMEAHYKVSTGLPEPVDGTKHGRH
uniref:Uncharacterized protein n=1 Tax=Anopheles culicifacies TaxID=139723 RepID=A0A182MCP5_9DIPT